MTRPFEFSLREASGALGDLGTLLPLVVGAIAFGQMSTQPVLLGFALFYIVTALVYRLPIPVQPMKAVAAVLLIGGATPGEVALSGALIGVTLTLMAVTGVAARLARLVPQSVLAGLQLGLGLALALLALDLMRSAPVFSVACLVTLGALFLSRLPAAALFLTAAVVAGFALGLPSLAPQVAPPLATAGDLTSRLGSLVLPQLSLTLMNAVLLTALVAGDFYGPAAARVTPGRLALTSGLANLCLAPFGALPMCHGAGGVAAHHRFGARTGGAPLMLGVALLAIALLPQAADLLTAVPAAALGALLMVTAVELCAQKRIFDCKPSCRPVIAATAAATVIWDPFLGLCAGTLAEIARLGTLRLILGPRSRSGIGEKR